MRTAWLPLQEVIFNPVDLGSVTRSLRAPDQSYHMKKLRGNMVGCQPSPYRENKPPAKKVNNMKAFVSLICGRHDIARNEC